MTEKARKGGVVEFSAEYERENVKSALQRRSPVLRRNGCKVADTRVSIKEDPPRRIVAVF